MIMDTMLQNIPQRLHEVNTLLATCRQGVFSFGEALPLSLFYRDFSDTNLLVKEAVCLVKENPGRLLIFPLPCFWKPKPTCPLDGHYVWQATKNRHWFGPTKAEISLVWLLGRGNSNNKKGGVK